MPAVASVIESASSLLFNVVSIGVVPIGLVVYFSRLEPAITELDRKFVDVRSTQIEQSLRVDRIAASRTVNLLRLSKTEEAVASLKDTLAKIDAKVDRLLMRSR